MITRGQPKSKSIKIISVAVTWVFFSSMFYFGAIGSYFVGHLELSVMVAFALVFFILHLFSILKKAAVEYL